MSEIFVFDEPKKTLAHTGSITASIGQHVAKLIDKSKVYCPSIQFMPGTNQTEATVRSVTNESQTRTVKFSEAANAPPTCCAQSSDGAGYSYLHRAAVIC